MIVKKISIFLLTFLTRNILGDVEKNLLNSFTGGKIGMAKKKEVVPAIIDSVEALTAKMEAMREAQREFATFTQEQVDKIFFEK